MPFVRDLKLSTKLVGSTLLIFLVSFVVLTWLNVQGAEEAVLDQARAELEAVRTSRGHFIETYLGRLEEEIELAVGFARSRQMLRVGSGAFQAYPEEAGLSPAALAGDREALEVFYETEVGPLFVAGELAWQGTDHYMPASHAAVALQAAYLARNPNPIGEKERLLESGAGTTYDRQHELFHPQALQMMVAFGFYDIFLVDLEGNVIYTATKEVDFATNLLSGPFSESPLAEAYALAMESPDFSEAHFVDYQEYEPSFGTPASFFSSAIVDDDGVLLGAMVFQMPVDQLNAFMTETAGLGDSGETYLVGPDLRMRTNSRFSEEWTILSQEVDTEAARRALAGESGSLIHTDYRGKEVLASYASIHISSATWAILAEMDRDEVLIPVRALRNRMALVGLLVFLPAGILLVLILRGVILSPLTALTVGARKVSEGSYDEPVGVIGGDELGQLGVAFNQMVSSVKGQMTELEEARNALGESQERLNGILDNTEAVVFLKGADGKYQVVNQSYVERVGAKAEDIIGRLDEEIFPAEMLEELKAADDKVMETAVPFTYEERITGTRGERIYQTTKFPVMSPDGAVRAIGGWATDITDQVAEGEKMASILDSSPDGMVIVDDTGIITLVNSRIEEMFGYAKAEIEGQPIEFLVPEEIRVPHAGWRDSFLANPNAIVGEDRLELRGQHKNGSIFPVEVGLGPVKTEDGLMVSASVQDITQRKKDEADLRFTQEVVDMAGTGIFWLEYPGFEVLYGNEMAAGRLGYEPEEMVGKKVWEVDPQFDPERAQALVETLKAEGAQTFETTELHKDGTLVDVEVTATFLSWGEREIVVAFVQEISDRKEAQKAIAQERAGLRSLIDGIPDLIFFKDAEGTYLACNEAFEDFFGQKESYLAGRSDADLYPPEEAQLYRESDQNVMASGETLRMERWEEDEDGKRTLLETRKIPYFGQAGESLGIIGISSDITEQRMAKEEIQAQKELVESTLASLREMELTRELALEAAQVGLWSGDLQNDTWDWDRRTNRMMGLPEDMPADLEKWVGALHPEDRQYVLDEFGAAIRGEKVYDVEYRAVWPDGSVRHIVARGRTDHEEGRPPTRIDGITYDVTDLKLAEADVKAQKELLESTVDSLPHPFYVIDADTFKIQIANAAAKALGGVGDRTCCYQITHQIEEPCNTSQHPCPLKIMRETKEPVVVEHVHFDEHGAPRDMEVHAYPILDDEGNLTQMIEYSLDITEKKAAEVAIRENQERLQGILDDSPVGVGITVDGVFRFGNRRIKELLPIEEGGSSPDLYVNPGDRDFIMEQLKTNQIVRDYELQMYTPEGEIGEFLVTYLPAEWEGKPGILGWVVDVSEVKRSERAIKDSQHKLKALFDALPVGVTMISREGKILEANSITEDILGVSADEHRMRDLAAQEWRVVRSDGTPMPPEEYPATRALMGEGQVKNVEMGVHRPQGDLVWINTSAAPVEGVEDGGVAVAFEDITERKKAAEELERVNFLADIALELTDSGYWHVDYSDPEYYYQSDRAATILGEPLREDGRYHLQDEWFARLEEANPETAAETAERYQGAIDGTYEKYESTYAYKRPADGQVVWVEAAGRIVRDKNDEVKFMYGAYQDVTQRKADEEAILASKDAAEAANRAKSNFLANMSHEIRTPMNAILGFSQLMERDPTLSKANRGHVDTILRSGEHLLRLINDILEMSKIEAGRTTLNPVTFDLRRTVEDLEAMFRVKTDQKGLHLLVEVGDGVPRFVSADEGKLQQVLINLLGNAVKFTDEGRVAFRAGMEATEEEGVAKLVVEVEDTGPGIAENDIDLVFRAFEQTEAGREHKGGSGLGLPISREFALLMGGDLSVKSEVGKGSIFRLEVEIQEGDAAKVVAPMTKRKVVGLAEGEPSRKLLVVDDKLENRILLTTLLEAAGLEVREAHDGQQAVAAFQEWEPDAVFMDMKMPIMDGHEATRRIKELPRGPDTPVIAITASVFDGDRSEVIASGCDEFIGKPFKEAEVFNALEKLLGIQFLYEGEEGGAEGEDGTAEPADSVSSLADAAASLPESLMAGVREACESLDDDALMELTEQVREHHEGLADRIQTLAGDFEFDQIIRLMTPGG